MNKQTRITIKAISVKLTEITKELKEFREEEQRKYLRLSPGLQNSPRAHGLLEARMNLIIAASYIEEAVKYLGMATK